MTVPAFDAETASVYRMASAWRNANYSAFIYVEIKTTAATAVWTYCRNFVHFKILLKPAGKNKGYNINKET